MDFLKIPTDRKTGEKNIDKDSALFTAITYLWIFYIVFSILIIFIYKSILCILNSFYSGYNFVIL